jgi:phosphatidylglycerol:prolipoprotein diacylglycerol transferase
MFPRLLQFGALNIPTHSALIALGLALGLLLAVRTSRLLKLDADATWNLAFTAIASYIVGGRVVLFVTHWRELVQYPALLLVVNSHSPAVLYGGICVALAVCAVSLWRHPLPLRRTLDALAAPIALAATLACVGAFAGGADYGAPTTLPWAVTFHSRYALMWFGTPLNIPLHPVQLYEGAIELLLCAFLLLLLKIPHRDGEIFGAWLFFAGIARFVLEFYRVNRGIELFGGLLDLTQAASLAMIVAGGILWMHLDSRETLHYAI